jgi:hypothetical protein
MLNRQRQRKPATMVRWVAGGFQRPGHVGQRHRHLAGDAGTDARRVQRHRVSPQQGQALAHRGVGQVLQADAVAAWVRKGGVGAARSGELGIQLDDMPDIDHHHEGRPALIGGQRAGVGLGLGAGAHQRVVKPLGGAAQVGLALAGVELLAFQHEGAAAVAVHPARAGAAVAVGKVIGRSNM